MVATGACSFAWPGTPPAPIASATNAAAQTDAHSFAALELKADGFRNHRARSFNRPAEHLLIDHAQLLTLTAPEPTVLVGGLRVLGANHDQSTHGVLTSRLETLTTISS